ncbi:MAG TPA: hypothetical protein VHK91_02345 [Flavisolibacter sp.]|jgi:hypothetical protein|nr:hypothetical protein [Flavisolibacter sp.]
MKPVILYGLIMLTACHKAAPIEEKEYVSMTYNQTQCADPWPYGTTESSTLQNVAKFLDMQGLYRAGLSMKAEIPPAACLACSCPTGKVIEVNTLNSSLLKEKYNKLGF